MTDRKPPEHERWVDMVAPSCTHSREARCWTITPVKEEPDHRDAMELYSWRDAQAALRRKPRGFPYAWGYVIQRCEQCIRDAYTQHRTEFWYLFPDLRRQRCVEALARLQVASKLTEDNIAAVIQVVRDCQLTREDFWNLDSYPGSYANTGNPFSYALEIDGHVMEWHWKLRQTRNRAGQQLFAELLANPQNEVIDG